MSFEWDRSPDTAELLAQLVEEGGDVGVAVGVEVGVDAFDSTEFAA